MKVERLLKRQDILGEGMMWLASEKRIAWVDILGKELMIAAPDGSDLRTYPQPSEIGAVLPDVGGDLVLVRRHEVVRFNEASKATELVWSATADQGEAATNRFNDAAIDPAGNLWIGSMDFDADAPNGNLWRITSESEATKVASGFKCLNGPAFSLDGSVLYLGDTMSAQVLAFDLELETGKLSNRRIFTDLNPFGGLCDGMAVDANDNLWICQITKGRIGCFRPDGSKLHSVALPVPMVTSCCFGGENLTSLYVTTARIILDDAELEAYPESGSLYQIDTGIKGVTPNLFGANGSPRL